MRQRERLSVAGIRALTPKQKIYQVTDGWGLVLEACPSGLMRWCFRFRDKGKPAKITLGHYPEMSLTDARIRRDELRVALRTGISPADERRERMRAATCGLTVKEFAERYLREYAPLVRKEVDMVRRYLERDIYPALGNMLMTAVKPEHIRDIVFARRDAGHGQAAVAIRNLLKRVWDYAIVCGVVTVNPTHAIPIKFIAHAQARTRALSEPEIALFLSALNRAGMRTNLKTALQLILLTLTRKSELRLARWEDIDLQRGEWEIPPEHSKTGVGQIVYLPRQARELLERLCPTDERVGCVFPALGSDGSTAIAPSTLNKALESVQQGMVHFTVHDLRRTGATRLSEMGFNSDWIEKALNHKLRGVRGVYNRAEYAAQRSEMLQAWADCLDSLRDSSKAA